VFLLFDGLEREEWSQKLAESREAYQALRAHFLKFIEHPDDVESTGDPLADDEEVSRCLPYVLSLFTKCVSRLTLS
jgi:TBC1 domain family protein 5